MNEMNPLTGQNIYWEAKEARIKAKEARTQANFEAKKAKMQALEAKRNKLESKIAINKINIGKQGILNINMLSIEINILDYKYEYGRDRFLVSPISGSGKIWTEKIEDIK